MVAWGIPDVLLDGEVRQAFPFLIPFGIIGLWRWALFTIRVLFWLCYRPIRPKRNKDGSSANQMKSSDVTIVVPTIDNGQEFLEAIKCWLINQPAEIIVVTSDAMKCEITETCHRSIAPHLFKVLSVSKPNKRVQMCAGINAAHTAIVALSDDDAIWTDHFLDWTLAPFDDDRMGGVSSKQVMTPVDGSVSFWEVIADFRLSMRMIETSASTFVDGGMSCLSGRTAIYRREILADPVFQQEFVNETWRGKYALHSGDDKFITRWLVSHNWKMQMQNHEEACLKTTFKNDSKFLKQVLRWTRNTWRSDIKSIFVERAVLRRHPYVAFNMFDKFINPLPLIWGLSILIGNVWVNGTAAATYVLLPVLSWLILSRTMRLVPHILKNPTHIVYIPAMILFQYFFVFAKIYALFTLHVTDWGSRATVAVGEMQLNFAFAKAKALFTLHVTDWGSRPTVAAGEVQLKDELGITSSPSSDSSADMVPTDVEVPSSKRPNFVQSRKNHEPRSLSSFVSCAQSVISEPSLAFFTASSAFPRAASIVEQLPRKRSVPYCARPAVLVETCSLVGLACILVYLTLVLCLQRTVYWDIVVISKQKSLSAERATGVGVYDQTVDKTFITYPGPFLVPHVIEYDHTAAQLISDVPVVDSIPAVDHNDYPRMVMADDGRLVAVYTNSGRTLHVTKCDTPHASTGPWRSSIINHDMSRFPCLIKTEGAKAPTSGVLKTSEGAKAPTSGVLYAFYGSRSAMGDYPIHYVKSIDHGETWTEPRIAIDAGDVLGAPLNEVNMDCPRLEPANGGVPERFAIGWTMACANCAEKLYKDAHFAYFYPRNDSFASVSGETLGGTIEYDEFEHTRVFDSGTLSPNTNMGYYFAPSFMDETRYPILVFNFNNTLISSTWTGTMWTHNAIVSNAAYNLFDLEKTGPRSFRLYHAQSDVLIFATRDGGANWKLEHRVKPPGGSVSEVIRIQDGHPDLSVVALENDWTLDSGAEQDPIIPSDLFLPMSVIGNFSVWALGEVNLNPLSNPYHPKTGVSN